MSHEQHDQATYVESFLTEDPAVAAARKRGEALGCVPVEASAGNTLRFLAAASQSRSVVEIGTGAGVSGLYLLAGMAPDGVLTSIDVEPEHQRAARAAYTAAGYPAGRSRLIMGRALDVLSRLTDGGYDLVFVDAAKAEYPHYLLAGLRLLRHGGIIAFDNSLWHGRVADPAHRDPDTLALRETARAVRDDERLVPALLPVGDGLLVAAKTGTDDP